MSEITINRGNTFSGTVTVTNADGTAKDITGYTLFFTVKKNSNSDIVTDSDAIISKTVTSHSDPTGGITTISLTSTDTTINPGTYFYDIKFKDSTGTWVRSSNTDKFNVRGVTTNRLS